MSKFNKPLLEPPVDPTTLPRVRIVGPLNKAAEARPLFVFDGEATFLSVQKIVDSAASLRVVAAELIKGGPIKEGFDSPRLLDAEVHPLAITLEDSGPDNLQPGADVRVLLSPTDPEWPMPGFSLPPVQGPVVPALRLEQGRIPIDLPLKKSVARFLQLKTDSILGSLPCSTAADKFPVVLTPSGIEFECSVPLPAPLSAGDPQAVVARVRLTWANEDDYCLQLVGGTAESLAKIRDALAGTLNDLRNQEAPLQIDYNTTLEVPPLTWPLIEKAGKLRLDGAEPGGLPGEWKAWKATLDARSVRSRIKTKPFGWTAAHDVTAEFSADAVQLDKSFDLEPVFQITATAGKPTKLGRINQWTREGSSWQNEFASPLEFGTDTFVDTREIRQRLQRSYYEGRAIDSPAADPVYAFLPLERGWLQAALPKIDVISTPNKSEAVQQVLSGEVHLEEPQQPRRGMQLEGASAVEVIARWGSKSLVLCTLRAEHFRGRLSGFLFCVDRSPTAQEALPTLTAGPSSTRELSLLFGYSAPQDAWRVAITGDLPSGLNLKISRPDHTERPDYLWLPDPTRPAIPNMPLTRSSASSEFASTNRHLLPLSIDKAIDVIQLRIDPKEPLPEVRPWPKTSWPDGLNWDKDTERLRLTFPTLPGVEFRPDPPTPSNWPFDATLRADLPILDELFANTELPQEKVGAAPAPQQTPATALSLKRLSEEVWKAARAKLDLACVDSFALAGPVKVDDAPSSQTISALVEPYKWKAPFGVKSQSGPTAEGALPAGSYSLNGTEYVAEDAAQGMKRQDFKVTGLSGALTPHPAGGVHVKNLAANLFTSSETGFRQDSRGFAVHQRVEPANDKYVARRIAVESSSEIQITLKGPFKVKRAADQDVSFWFGNMSFPDPSEMLAFNGVTNPVERLDSTSGAGGLLKPAQIPDSMHEWRLYVDGLMSHVVPLGHFFLFRPLRLLGFSFDKASGKPGEIRVLGNLTLAKPSSHDKAEPFHSDDPHASGNLVEWDVSANRLYRHKAGAPTTPLVFLTQCRHLVHRPEEGGEPEYETVSVRLEYAMDAAGVDPHAPSGTWTATFPIAGVEGSRTGGALSGDSTSFSVTFASSPVSQVALAKVIVTFAELTVELDVEPRLELFVNGAPGSAHALHWTPESLQWFGARAKSSGDWTFRLSTGLMSIPVALAGGWSGAVPPGLSAATLDLRGYIECLVRPDAADNAELKVLALFCELCGTLGTDGLILTHTAVIGSQGDPKHELSISGSLVRRSRIEWPDVAEIKPSSYPNSILVKIPKSDKTVVHDFTICFDGHGFPIERLRDVSGTLALEGDWRFEARVNHILTEASDEASTRLGEWPSLDQLRVQSQPGWIKEAKARRHDIQGFVPLPRQGDYRGKDVEERIARAGIGEADLASSGLRDEHLANFIAGAPEDPNDIYIFGASFQLHSTDGTQHRPLLWRYFSLLGPRSPAPLSGLRLAQRDPDRDLYWRVSDFDNGARLQLWIEGRDGSSLQLGSLTSESAILAAAEKPAGAYDWVEQEFFEPVPPGKVEAATAPGASKDEPPGAGTPPPSEYSFFPYFITALLALRKIIGQGLSTDVCQTVRLPNRTAHDRTLRVSLARMLLAPEFVESETFIVLSGSVLESVHLRTKAVDPGTIEFKARASNTSLARALAVQPFAALHRKVGKDGVPRFTPVPLLPARIDALPPRPQGSTDPVVPPSPALGWPSTQGIADAVRQFARIGDDDVLVSNDAGLAGRGIVTGWPAWGPPPAMAGIFYNSHTAVQFRRISSGTGFKGPTPRHLVPVPSRVRVPTGKQIDDTLSSVALRKEQSEGKWKPIPGDLAPISVPSLEQSVFGLRPGAFHIMTTSVTVPADAKPFDEKQPRFGRPGSRGTALLHQLRAPRGTPLPRTDDLAYRRRTFLSEADCENGHLALFAAFGGSAAVFRKWREEQNAGAVSAATGPCAAAAEDDSRRTWRFVVRPDGESFLNAEWDGKLTLKIEAATTGAPACFPAVLAGLGILPRTEDDAKDHPQIDLVVGSRTFPFDKLAWVVAPLSASLTLRLIGGLESAQLALLQATSNTSVGIQIRIFEQPDDAPPIASPCDLKRTVGTEALVSGPPDVIRVPLWINPGRRRFLELQATTVAFGDPSYDRQLASPTLSNSVPEGLGNILLALDRQEYDRDSAIFLAFGFTPRPGEPFEPKGKKYYLTFYWMSDTLPADAGNVTQVPLQPGNVELDAEVAYSIPLSAFTYEARTGPGQQAARPVTWSHGDKLIVTVSDRDPAAHDPATRTLSVTARVVAVPQIAPPPSVYSVIRKGPDDNQFLDVPLHASGPMPQRIEFVNLLRDLALGHVRRRALFVWSWAEGAQQRSLTLVKVDRAGGTQIPIAQCDFKAP